jgi:hypothetical protein
MHDTVILWPHTVRTRSGASQSDAATRSGARRRAVLLAMLRCAAALFLSVLTNQTEPNSDSQEQLAKVGASQYLLEYCAVLLIGTEARATPARPRQAVHCHGAGRTLSGGYSLWKRSSASSKCQSE